MDENTIFALVYRQSNYPFSGSAAFDITALGLTRNTAIVAIPNDIMANGVLPFFYRFVLSFSVYFRFVTVSSFSSLYQICAQVYLHYIHKSLSCKAVLLRAISKWNLNARGRWVKLQTDPSGSSITNMVS